MPTREVLSTSFSTDSVLFHVSRMALSFTRKIERQLRHIDNDTSIFDSPCGEQYSDRHNLPIRLYRPTIYLRPGVGPRSF